MMPEPGTNNTESAPTKARGKEAWHYKPDQAIEVSPYFRWPPDIAGVLKWMIGGWFPLSERIIILLLAIVAAVFFAPTLESTSVFSFDWVAGIFVRNVILMCLVAGGLHLYFYTFKLQGDKRRFDTKPFPTNNRAFTFRSQLKDNMFWTLVSGVTVWTAYEALMMWALSNNYAPALTLPGDLVWLVLIVFFLPVWETTHFFLIHRLIHSVPLYQRIHALHHRNTNVGPWSGLSMHPLEHVIYLSTVLIHFVVPSNPMLIIFHLSYFTLSAATTHTGYQGILWKNKLVLPLGTFHHQLHHRYFTCNYGGLEIPWDKWTGSFHDGTDDSHKRFIEKRKRRTTT